ncbi:MAG: glutamate-5-semialdehyde dehydrogenase [Clostridia bacterium]|nr:glutamate-5-semialdehyde dehydrogenase [Clostridia bacterium]
MQDTNKIYDDVRAVCRAAKNAWRSYASTSTTKKDQLLCDIASGLSKDKAAIFAANAADLENARAAGISAGMLDRLTLDEKRLSGICSALFDVAKLPDPIGSGTRTTRPNGLQITCTRAPIGTVAIIYEARPNVTVDAAALCLKTGNAVVLRGGKEAINTNRALVTSIKKVLSDNGYSPNLVGLIESTDRESSVALMNMRGLIDVLIPRGGKGLIRSVVENAKVPVIETGAGNCHLFVDASADLDMAISVAVNAKCSRPSVCNAIETLLVHRDVCEKLLPALKTATVKYDLEFRGCGRAAAILGCALADESDWDTEYNDYILAVRVVDSLDEAIDHINKYSTGHSEAIITENVTNANRFTSEIDAAAVYVNASTRFTDGGEFGFGAEIGISTQKLHARGPMGLYALTTDKYIVSGNGQIR